MHLKSKRLKHLAISGYLFLNGRLLETLLKEKTALVIGGTSGIGRSVVETFSSCGANVVVVGRSKSGYSKISF